MDQREAHQFCRETYAQFKDIGEAFGLEGGSSISTEVISATYLDYDDDGTFLASHEFTFATPPELQEWV